MKFTAVYLKVPDGYLAFVEELPGANAQAATLDEARRKLAAALSLVFEANRAQSRGSFAGPGVTREPLALPAG